MRYPQDYLLVVYALSFLAYEHKGTQKDDWTLNLAAEIADQHGLTASGAVRQLEYPWLRPKVQINRAASTQPPQAAHESHSA